MENLAALNSPHYSDRLRDKHETQAQRKNPNPGLAGVLSIG